MSPSRGVAASLRRMLQNIERRDDIKADDAGFVKLREILLRRIAELEAEAKGLAESAPRAALEDADGRMSGTGARDQDAMTESVL